MNNAVTVRMIAIMNDEETEVYVRELELPEQLISQAICSICLAEDEGSPSPFDIVHMVPGQTTYILAEEIYMTFVEMEDIVQAMDRDERCGSMIACGWSEAETE